MSGACFNKWHKIKYFCHKIKPAFPTLIDVYAIGKWPASIKSSVYKHHCDNCIISTIGFVCFSFL